jgi:hypothetical protein
LTPEWAFLNFFRRGQRGPVRALDGASGTRSFHVAQMEDVAMSLNFDPFWRSSVGFDRILDLMDESLRYQP